MLITDRLFDLADPADGRRVKVSGINWAGTAGRSDANAPDNTTGLTYYHVAFVFHGADSYYFESYYCHDINDFNAFLEGLDAYGPTGDGYQSFIKDVGFGEWSRRIRIMTNIASEEQLIQETVRYYHMLNMISRVN